MINYSYKFCNSIIHPSESSYIVRCKDEFEQNINADTVASMQGMKRDQPQQIGNEEQAIDIWNDYCQLVDEISKNSTIGSDEKFQLFICLCLR